MAEHDGLRFAEVLLLVKPMSPAEKLRRLDHILPDLEEDSRILHRR